MIDLSFGQRADYYAGIAQTEIKYYGYNIVNNEVSLYLDHIKNCTNNIKLFISDPLIINGAEKEKNPFNIITIQSGHYPQEGEIDLLSALLVPLESGRIYLAQYWQYDLEGTTIKGKLINTHASEGANLNIICAWYQLEQMLYPYDIAVNTSMEGSITKDSINMKIVGQAAGYAIYFTTVIKAGNMINVANEPTFTVQDKLEQNYPNPFHSNTQISFEIAKKSAVTLSVYNLQGECVAELIKSEMEAGGHSIAWNANDQQLPSGTYLIKLKTDDFVQIRKCNLIK